MTSSYEALNAHADSCDTCLRRATFVEDRFGPSAPYPVGGLLGRWMVVAEVAERFPGWFRPALAGAAILAMMAAPAVLWALVQVFFDGPIVFLIAFGAIFAAAAGGAVGGLTYSLLGRPLRRLGRIGDYPAGIITAFGYLGSIGVAAHLFGEPLVSGRGGLIAFGIVGTFFGLLVGHWWFAGLDR